MCKQARDIHIGKLQQLAQGADHIFEDKQGKPTLSVRAGEGVSMFTCTAVLTILRSSTQCCQELPVTVAGQELFMKPLTKSLTTHCTARTCSSTLPAVFNLGTAKKPAWVNIGQYGIPYPAHPPAKFVRKTSLQELASPQYQTMACTWNSKG